MDVLLELDDELELLLDDIVGNMAAEAIPE